MAKRKGKGRKKTLARSGRGGPTRPPRAPSFRDLFNEEFEASEFEDLFSEEFEASEFEDLFSEEFEASEFEDLFSEEFEASEREEETRRQDRLKQLESEGRDWFDYEEEDRDEVQEVRRWDIREYMNDLSEQGFKVTVDYGSNSAEITPGTESELNADLFFTAIETEFFERFHEAEEEAGAEAGSPDLVYKVHLNADDMTASVSLDRGTFSHGGMITGMPIRSLYNEHFL